MKWTEQNLLYNTLIDFLFNNQEATEKIYSSIDLFANPIDATFFVALPLLTLSVIINYVAMPCILRTYNVIAHARNSYKAREHITQQGYGDSKNYIVSNAANNAAKILHLQNHPNTAKRHKTPQITKYISDLALSTLSIAYNIQTEQATTTTTQPQILNIFKVARRLLRPITKRISFSIKSICLTLSTVSLSSLACAVYYCEQYTIEQMLEALQVNAGWFIYGAICSSAAAITAQSMISLLTIPIHEIFLNIKEVIKSHQDPADLKMEMLQNNNDIMELYLHTLLYKTKPLTIRGAKDTSKNDLPSTNNLPSPNDSMQGEKNTPKNDLPSPNDSISSVENNVLAWLETLKWFNSTTPRKQFNPLSTDKEPLYTLIKQTLHNYSPTTRSQTNTTNNYVKPKIQKPESDSHKKPNTIIQDSNAAALHPTTQMNI